MKRPFPHFPHFPHFPLGLVAACILAGCADDRVAEPVVIVPPEPTFVVFGIVRDEAGLPVTAAIAEIVEGRGRGMAALSNKLGYFSLAVPAGPLTVRVWEQGYDLFEKSLMVDADQAVDVTLKRFDGGDGIALGRTIRSSITQGAAPCDPIHWDARAPCRRYSFIAPATGQLRVSVAWISGSPMDIVVTTPAGTYLGSSESAGVEKESVNVFVQEGATYEVRVSAYYQAQAYYLRADLLLPGSQQVVVPPAP